MVAQTRRTLSQVADFFERISPNSGRWKGAIGAVKQASNVEPHWCPGTLQTERPEQRPLSQDAPAAGTFPVSMMVHPPQQPRYAACCSRLRRPGGLGGVTTGERPVRGCSFPVYANAVPASSHSASHRLTRVPHGLVRLRSDPQWHTGGIGGRTGRCSACRPTVSCAIGTNHRIKGDIKSSMECCSTKRTGTCALRCTHEGVHWGAATRGAGRAARSPLAAHGQGWGAPRTVRRRPRPAQVRGGRSPGAAGAGTALATPKDPGASAGPAPARSAGGGSERSRLASHPEDGAP